MSYIITCPTCGFKGTPDDFCMSLSNECFCPAEKGCEWFELGSDDEDEDEEE